MRHCWHKTMTNQSMIERVFTATQIKDQERCCYDNQPRWQLTKSGDHGQYQPLDIIMENETECRRTSSG